MSPAAILTFSGKLVDPLHVRPDQISIEDIAHALSQQCRYSGHTRWHYSVAQHCCHVSQLVPVQYAMWGLLHDAGEAYLIDMPAPIKPAFPEYCAAEDAVSRVIWDHFGLTGELPDAVHQVDRQMCVNEMRDLMNWLPAGAVPIPEVRVRPLDPSHAKRLFLSMFDSHFEAMRDKAWLAGASGAS